MTVQHLCEIWSCTPEEALRQDPELVIPILGYLQAKEAIRQSNDNLGSLTRVQGEILARLRGETLEPTAEDESWLLGDDDQTLTEG